MTLLEVSAHAAERSCSEEAVKPVLDARRTLNNGMEVEDALVPDLAHDDNMREFSLLSPCKGSAQFNKHASPVVLRRDDQHRIGAMTASNSS